MRYIWEQFCDDYKNYLHKVPLTTTLEAFLYYNGHGAVGSEKKIYALKTFEDFLNKGV